MGRTTWMLAACLLAALPAVAEARAPRSPLAQDCAEVDVSQWKSGCGSVSLSAAKVRPGDQLSVTVSAGGGACASEFQVSCSWAELEVLLDGQAVTAGGGPAPLYWGYGSPIPSPSGPNAVVNVSAGTHSVVFTIRDDAPEACLQLVDTGSSIRAEGPFVSFGRNGTWSTPVPFKIDPNAGRSVEVSLTAQSQQPGQVKPGQTIQYIVEAVADDTADRLELSARIPRGTTLIELSVSDTDHLVNADGSTLAWAFDEVSGAQVSYTVQVLELGHRRLKKFDEIRNKAHAAARFGEISSGDRDVARLELLKIKPGELTYYSVNGAEHGKVVVGYPITVAIRGWDADYGPVTVTYQGEPVGTLTPPEAAQAFEVPAFEKNNFKAELLATQGPLERRMQLKGLPEFLVALSAGGPTVKGGHKLKAGRFLAEGELELGAVDFNLNVPDGAAAAVVTGQRIGLVVNRQTGIQIVGSLSARRKTALNLSRGTVIFDRQLTAPLDLNQYDPAEQPNLTVLSPGEQAGLSLAGFARCTGDLTVTGPLHLDGGILFVEGHLDLRAGLSGTGEIFATRNLRVTGPISFRTDNIHALAAGRHLLLLGER